MPHWGFRPILIPNTAVATISHRYFLPIWRSNLAGCLSLLPNRTLLLSLALSPAFLLLSLIHLLPTINFTITPLPLLRIFSFDMALVFLRYWIYRPCLRIFITIQVLLVHIFFPVPLIVVAISSFLSINASDVLSWYNSLFCPFLSFCLQATKMLLGITLCALFLFHEKLCCSLPVLI